MPSQDKGRRAEQQRLRRKLKPQPKDVRNRNKRARPEREAAAKEKRAVAARTEVITVAAEGSKEKGTMQLGDVPARIVEQMPRLKQINRMNKSERERSLSARDSMVGSAVVSVVSSAFLCRLEDELELKTHAGDLPDQADLERS